MNTVIAQNAQKDVPNKNALVHIHFVEKAKTTEKLPPIIGLLTELRLCKLAYMAS